MVEPSTEQVLPAEKAVWIARRARAELGKRDFAVYVRQAIDAGVVHGISKVEWGPHLEGFCIATQMQLEAWLVCNDHSGPRFDEDGNPLPETAMVRRQREAWERTGATWEDGLPEPWLRYPLVQNEVDNLPPGTLKSTIGMVLANTWVWLHCATFVYGAASSIDANVTRDSNAARDIVRSAWYRESFQIAWDTLDVVDEEGQPIEPRDPIGINAKADAVSDWRTSAGGHRYSRTMQRGFTGLHVDGIFIDDPDDADRVKNEAARVRPQNRFTRAMENRVNDERRSIRKVMQQKLDLDDFSAYLLSIARWSPENPKGWFWFCLAAEFGYQPEDAPIETPYGWRDWRTAKGETIHPRLSPGVLADKRTKLGAGYEAQYNQNPGRGGAGIFKARHARFFVFEGESITALRRRPDAFLQRSELPPRVIKLSDLDRITLSVDAANSLDPKPGAKVSAVGLVVGGCKGEDRFVLDDRTKVLGVSAMYRAIYATIRAWPLELALVELKAMGPSVIFELEKAVRRGWYVDPETDEKIELLGPDGKRAKLKIEAYNPGQDSKLQRAHGMLQPWEESRFYFHDGSDHLYPQVDDNRRTVDEGLLGEVCSFPGSLRSDRIDSISQFISKHRDNDPIAKFRALAKL